MLYLSSNNTEGKRGRDYTYGRASVNRFINRRPRSRLTIRQRTRVLKEWPPAREVLLPSTTNEILEAVASQQINKIGHCDDFTMHQSGNHVKLRKGAIPKNTATNF